MAGVVVDSLITKLEYEYDAATLKAAEASVKALEQQNKATAASADKLSAENQKLAEYTDQLSKAQGDLAEQLADSARETDKLVDEQRELARQAKAAGGATDEQRKRLDHLDAEIRKSRQHTRELREESARLGREKQKVGLESRKLSRAQADVSRSSRKAATDQRQLKDAMRAATERAKEEAGAMETLGDRIKAVSVGELAADAVRSLGANIFEAGKQVLETGTNFESLRARLKTVEGSSEGAARAFALIQDFTSTTPFQLDEVTTAFVRLKSLGLDANRDSLAAFGNIAAAQGKSMIDFIEAVADASTGEFERLKEFGIKASSQGDQVAFTFAGTTTKVGKNAKEISAFLKELGETKFAGAMADQMATTAGALSNFHDTVSQTLDTLAQDGPLQAFNALLRETTQAVTGDNGLGTALSSVLVSVLEAARAAMAALQNDEVSGFLQAILNLVGALVDIFVKVGEALAPVISMWLQWWGLVGDTIVIILEFLGAIIDVAMALADVLGPLLLLVPALRALFILKVVLDLLEYFVDLLKRVVANMDPFIDRLTSMIDRLPHFASMFSGVTEAVRSLAVEIGVMNDELGATGSVAQAAVDALRELKKEQGDLSQVTMDELQEMRRQGGDAGAAAEKEIRRRMKQNETEEKQAEASGKSKQRKEEANKRAEKAAERFDKMSDSELESFAADVNVPKKLRDKAEKEIIRRDKKADKDDAAAKKRGAKKAKKEQDKLSKSLLTADLDKQFDELAKAAGQRAAARAMSRAAQAGKPLSEEQINDIELAERKRVKENLAGQYEATGQLPPGMAMELRQTAALPNIEEAGGRLAPPVISITNWRVEITGNTFEANITVEGGAAGTPAQIAAAVSTQAMPITLNDLGKTIQNQLTNER